MRQPANDQLGEIGENAVELFFNNLGWGPLRTHKHDLGTDVFVQIRNEDLVDLRMMLGVQVKTGASWFSEPAVRDGQSGWWFREGDKRHADYWSNHHIPHILVLQTGDMATRVWTVLDRSTIEDTGAGIRVFVPETKLFTPAARAEWLDLVAEARKLQSFEGSRWTFSIEQVPTEDWARYALLAPRLVAPHPNQGFSRTINWAEAVALCVEGEPYRWDRFAEQRDDVPSRAEAAASDESGWRFAAAVYEWVTGSPDSLVRLDADALPRFLKVARAVCLALALTDRDDLNEALDLLRVQRDYELFTADQTWLSVHIAHIQRALGEFAQAREELDRGLETHAAIGSDVTTSALRAAGVLAIFEMAPSMSGDVGSAVVAADTSLSWWRTHLVSHALENVLKRTFKKWARDRSITFGATDVSHNRLFAAALTARLAGNFGAWKSDSSLMAQVDLAVPLSGEAKPAGSLELLRKVGDNKTLELALRHLRDSGPLSAVTEFMSDVSPGRMTTMSFHADLEALKVAGAYLPETVAREWVEYLLSTLRDPEPFQTRFALEFMSDRERLEALDGIKDYLSLDDQRQVLTYAISLPDDASQLIDSPLLSILNGMESEVVSERTEQIATRLQQGTLVPWLSEMFRNILASSHEDSRGAVRQALLSGNLAALSGVRRIDQLDPAEADAVLEKCSAVFQELQGPVNGVSFGGPDHYRIAAQIALFGPSAVGERAWQLLVSAVAHPSGLQEKKRGALKILAGETDSIPERQRDLLREAAGTLRHLTPSVYSSNNPLTLPSVSSAFAEIYLEMTDEGEEWTALLAEMLTSDERSRLDALDLLSRRPGHELLLLGLTRDENPKIAERAMYALARRATEDPQACGQFLDELIRLARSGGEGRALSIGGGIVSAARRGAHIDPLVETLKEHESPVIRRLGPQLDPEQEN